jgi:hypothetical protein
MSGESGWCRRTVNISIIEGFLVEVPLRGGEYLLTKPSRQELAREREGVPDTNETSGRECDNGDAIGGRGRGVDGPINESMSIIDGSEGGVGQDCSSAAKLANIKRWAPDFDFRLSILGRPKSGTNFFLVGTAGIEVCLDSGIKP